LVYANIIGYLRDWWHNPIQERSWLPYGDFFGLLGE